MSNELLLILTALVDIVFVFLAARAGSRWIFGTMAVNLILINIFGSKFITVYGLATNAGNVFYACVFLATHFYLEKREDRGGLQTIWFGSMSVFFFMLLSQLTLYLHSSLQVDSIQKAIETLFLLSPRIALASILAYIFAQYVNIFIYKWFRKKTSKKFLWLRSNIANIGAQLVDSSIFFTLAFIDLPGFDLVKAIFAGWIIKTLVVALGTPFLYIDAYLNRNNT